MALSRQQPDWFDDPTKPKGNNMTGAKLIKREDWQDREQSAKRKVLLASAALVRVETVRDWVRKYQSAPKQNSHQKLAELFAPPKTSKP